MHNHLKDEIHNVLSGKIQVSFGATIQTIAGYLNNGKRASPTPQDEKHFKKQEAEKLERFITRSGLWLRNIDFTQYVSEGAEQKVYLKDSAFENTRNNDYYNSSLGIILEDLQDENVLTKNEILFFVDTVFYLTHEFWKE